MASDLACSPFCRAGKATRDNRTSTTRKAMPPQMSSSISGRTIRVALSAAASSITCIVGLLLDQEEEHEPEKRERFGQREPEEHDRSDQPRGLGLARNGLD